MGRRRETATNARVQRRVGPYRMLQELGRGGMGIVYKALDEENDRLVAIKVLPPNFLSDKRKKNYLHHEFQIALELKHPNIVTFYKFLELASDETGSKEGFLVMELVDGWTLKNHCDDQDLSLYESIDLCIEICKGLSFIHQKGIFHADVKPGNVLIAKDMVKVADFGLSSVQRLFTIPFLSKKSRLRGTPRYMAPEQLRHKKEDIRTDIYSLGVTLYELFTGKSPYKSKNTMELQKEIINRKAQPLPPSEAKKTLPRQMDHILLHALAKDPDKRYQSITEIVMDLNRLKRIRL